MAWLTTLRDQFPLLLVLSPLMGVASASVAAFRAPDLTRYFAISNCVCTLLILVGIEWQYESDLVNHAAIIRFAEQAQSAENSEIAPPEQVRRKLDRMRSERIQNHRFVADGVNIFPALLLSVVTALIVCRFKPSQSDRNFSVPLILFFQSAALGTLLANDVIVFLLLSGLSVASFSFLIGIYGPTERRAITERYLWEQCWGGSLILIGFSLLVVSIPWMKLQDSIGTPALSTSVSSIVQDIQRWTTRNELAFHYQSEIFPWMLLVISIGFAIVSGLFPFHVSQINIIRNVPAELALLYVVGGLSANRIGWFRFVMPLSPDLLASFDEWVVIASVGGAIWGALKVFDTADQRNLIAYAFLSLSGMSLMGSYTFSWIGLCGTWLMQQQLNVLMCAALLTVGNAGSSGAALPPEPRFPTRTLLLLTGLPVLYFFSSGSLIISELFRESLLLVTIMAAAVTLIVFKAIHMLNDRFSAEQQGTFRALLFKALPRTTVLSYVLALLVAVLPSLLLRQCEPEFVRVFRRFEQSQAAVPADRGYVQRQSAP
ncbi:hypothetical protein [Schlesneria sp. DSM 10557]|uniref:hypothetical protein n=1 Tax=Schlesneria sp. DSM 10557 TaxID=3044399 RepID=UPI0035A0633A